MASSSITITPARELTFKVEVAQFSETSPDNTLTMSSPCYSSNSYWTITLTRRNHKLYVGIKWARAAAFGRSEVEMVRYMHLVSFTRPFHLPIQSIIAPNYLGNGGEVQADIDIGWIQKENQYVFDIVLSCSQELTRPSFELDTKVLTQEIHDNLVILLKDVHSANVQFVFTKDPDYAGIGLRAHRSILLKYKGLESILSTPVLETSRSEKDQRDKSNQVVPTVTVDTCALSTFCVMLKYIYTGEINLAVDATHFAFSDTDPTVVYRTKFCGGKIKSTLVNRLWKLKEVTWKELLIASDEYSIPTLKERCLQEVMDAITQENAVATLFELGLQFPSIKKVALEVVAKDMGDLFEGDKNPFADYAHRRECLAFLAEAIRTKCTLATPSPFSIVFDS